MNLEGQNFNTKTVKLEKEPLNGDFLQEQIRLPKDQWDEKFKKLIEEKIGENQNDGNEESEESSEILQELTFKRYLSGRKLN